MNNKAYTLIEILVVLFIVCVILFIMGFNYVPTRNKNYLKKEANYLGSTMESMKLKSLTQNKKSRIKITESGFECFLGGKSILKHKFKKHLNINSTFKDNEIKITEDGMVERGGNVEFSNGKDYIKLIITISFGRYKVE